eukprot:scaffold89231_cov25-Tisochrysis_lutea.AAC.4
MSELSSPFDVPSVIAPTLAPPPTCCTAAQSRPAMSSIFDPNPIAASLSPSVPYSRSRLLTRVSSSNDSAWSATPPVRCIRARISYNPVSSKDAETTSMPCPRDAAVCARQS